MSKDEPKADFSIHNVEKRVIRTFDIWCSEMGFTGRRAGLNYLSRAMAKDRLFVLDKPTKAVLVGEATDELELKVRMWTRRETRNVLWEEGFLNDPAEESEIVERAKP